MSKEVALSDKEQSFVDLVIETRGNVQLAALQAGYCKEYGYVLRKKLANHIADAAQEFLSMQAVKAAFVVVDHMDNEMPNPIHLAAAKDVLDRSGVKRVQDEVQPTIKANIFILPEKRPLEAIEVSYTEIKN